MGYRLTNRTVQELKSGACGARELVIASKKYKLMDKLKSNSLKIAAFVLITLCQLHIGYTVGSAYAEKKLNQELIDRGVKEYNNRTGLLQYVAMLGLYSSNTQEQTADVIPGAEALLPTKSKPIKK